MDIRKVQDAIRHQILSLQDIRDIIEDRCYPSELAATHNPAYPCVNFSLLKGPTVGTTKEVGYTILQVWAWATDSYDAAGELLSLVESQLSGQRIETEECYVALYISMTPEQLYDEADTIYGYVERFNLMYIVR